MPWHDCAPPSSPFPPSYLTSTHSHSSTHAPSPDAPPRHATQTHPVAHMPLPSFFSTPTRGSYLGGLRWTRDSEEFAWDQKLPLSHRSLTNITAPTHTQYALAHKRPRSHVHISPHHLSFLLSTSPSMSKSPVHNHIFPI
ncbi:hypothetical protein BOTBODRAFT_71161 [Botryobasidium botryosum FD-172 SS1]|uniref:Uncharacterized protein n=1 Tax=Botryobasidium botryosum (strain FD-172 SS1) TaxID=930990 RepID=A0A067LSA6_BOTB1|nr:hypothetical protein BOTBODRAFT_71161 [Botryobasidium botryosum FD-172 SS1]